VKDWELIGNRLSKSGWSLGWVSALDREGGTIWIVDAHGYGKRFVVRADEKLAAFIEQESAIRRLDAIGFSVGMSEVICPVPLLSHSGSSDAIRYVL
jgi:hypothetical protein